MRHVRVFGIKAAAVLIFAAVWSHALIAQSHYDYWPLMPSIMLKFQGSELLFEDTLDFPAGIKECNHVASFSDSHGSLKAYGYGDILLSAMGDTIHFVNNHDEQAGCNPWSSVLMLPILRDLSVDTQYVSLVYPRQRPDVLYTFYHKKLSLDSVGNFLLGNENQVGRQITTNPSGGQTLAVRHGNGRDWWIILLECSEDPYFFKIDQRWRIFLHTPDSLYDFGSTADLPSPQTTNEVAMSKSGDQFALTTSDALLRFSFDRCNGTIGTVDTIAAELLNVGACSYSPDGTKLYAGNRKRSLYVFDLETPDYPIDTVFQGAGIFGYETMNLELGPDDRLYWGFELHTGFGAVDPTRYLMRVENPNADFEDLVFDTFAVYLNGFRNRTNALPNFPNYELGRLVGSPCDTLFVDTTTALPAIVPSPDWRITPSMSQTGFRVTGPQPLRWEVFAVTGERIASGTSAWIEAASWPQGVYIVQVGDARHQKRIKVVRP